MKTSSQTAHLAPMAKDCNHPRHAVVFLGDSLTSGHGLPSHEALPAQVENLIAASTLARRWRTVNAGVSGNTSAEGLARLPAILAQNPKVLFVCLGANDGLRGIPSLHMERNLESIVTKAHEAGVEVVLGGLEIPLLRGIFDEFSAVFPRVAKKFRLPYLPFLLHGVAFAPQYVLADGIHPNAAATRRMAETVWKVLESVLERTSRPAPPQKGRAAHQSQEP